jgi:predicted nucleic acid-binding protein
VKENHKCYVLDTSAIFCLKDNEEGAEQVETILEEAREKHCTVIVSFMALMEYLYISLIRYGEETARQSYLHLTLLPVTIVESDEETRLLASEFKAGCNVSVADAWIAAASAKNNAILVHKDPEYEALNNKLQCIALPYKK